MSRNTKQSRLKIQDVYFSFTTSADGNVTQVLNGITFSVPSGEFICILGPSGCGKTTLLQVIAGLLPLQHGHISLPDSVANHQSVVPCTMLFQSLNLFYWLTARGNVAIALRARGVKRLHCSQIAADYLKQVGLSGFEDFYPHELSGGMQQRLALARALATNAPLLLLDEPFSNLDFATQQAIEADLLRVWSEHSLTILMVTHDIQEALRLADRVIILSPRPATIRDIVNIVLPRPRDTNLTDTLEYSHIEELLCQNSYFPAH